MLNYILRAARSEMAAIRESAGITWLLIAATSAATLYWVWSLIRPRYHGYNIPPFPLPRRFLVGHLLTWARKDQLQNITECREAGGGDIFSVDLAGRLLVVVSGYETIREILYKHWKDAPDRPDANVLSSLGEDNHGVINSKGDNWKEQRATALMILRTFGMGKNLLADKVMEEVTTYVDKLVSFKGEPVDIRTLTNISVSNIICSIIVGKRFDYEDPYFIRLMESINFMFSKAPQLGVIQAVPLLKYLPGDIFGIKAFVKNVRSINENFSKAHISEAKKSFNKDETPSDFISAYLQKMHQDTSKGQSTKLDDPNLIASIRGLFLAGTETTSSTIYWCVLICLYHPEVQDKVFEEISTHVGHNRLPNMNDRPNLRYLDAVIRESQRYVGLVPLVARTVQETFEIRGHTVPKDTTIILNLRSALRDPKIWQEPDEFRPDRFLDADGNLISPDEFIPFGLGRRVCLGEALAKMELFLFLAAMFQRFRFVPENPGDLPSLEGHLTIVFTPNPYKVRLVPRHS